METETNRNNKKAGFLSFWLLRYQPSERSPTQTSNCLPPSLGVPVGGEETFHPKQQALYCKENTFAKLKKKKTIKFWSRANRLYTFYILRHPFECSNTNYSSIFWLPGDPSSRTQF